MLKRQRLREKKEGGGVGDRGSCIMGKIFSCKLKSNDFFPAVNP